MPAVRNLNNSWRVRLALVREQEDAGAVTTRLRAGLATPAERRDRLPAAAERLSRGVLVTALAAGLVAPGLLVAIGPVLLVLAGLLGLPHGAVDHLAWSWSHGETGRPRARLLAGYAAAALLAVAVALAFPVPALLILLALSAAHFAEGEIAWIRQRDGAVNRVPGAAAGVAAVTLPLLLRPEMVRPLLSSLDPTLPLVLLHPGVRLPLLLATGVLVFCGLVAARHDLAALGELSLVVAVAAVLPPLAAFAAWFAGWHAVRHTARLVRLDPQNTVALSRGELSAPLWRFARAAALPSAMALLGTLALAAVVGLTGGLLLALLALTVPHTAVVVRLGAQTASGGAVCLRAQPCAR